MQANSGIARITAIILAVVITAAAIVGIAFYVQQTAPRPPKELVLAFDKEEFELDPVKAGAGSFTGTALNLITQTLVTFDYDMKIVPYLAQSVQQLDARTYVFKLRPNVVFHDGTPLNASAVKFNFERAITGKVLRSADFAIVDRVEVVDDLTVRVILKQVNVDFLASLAYYFGIVSPTAVQKYGADFGVATVVGTGPYQFVEWVRGDHLIMHRFDQYWGTRANIDKITLRIIPEASVRALEVERGTVQGAELTPEGAKRLENRTGIKLSVAAASEFISLSINLNASVQAQPALLDKRVRQALNYAVNRQALAQQIFYGYVTPGVGPITPLMRQYWDPALSKYPVEGDIAKARQLLTEAGYPNGFEMEILSFFPWDPPVVTVLQDQLARVGIRVKILRMELAAGAAKLLVTRDFSTAIHNWGGFGPTPNLLLGQFYDSTQVGDGCYCRWNLQAVKDPVLDDIVRQLRVELDPENVKRLTDQLQRRVIEEAYGVILYYPNRIHATVTALSGYKIHPHPWYGFILKMDALGTNVDYAATTQSSFIPFAVATTLILTLRRAKNTR